MNIRKSRLEDLPAIFEIYAGARVFMAAHGNATQWGTTNPPAWLIEQDVRLGKSYVCEHQGHIAAVFFFSLGPDAGYHVIEDGEWRSQEPYGVVHRIASNGTVRGAASFCLDWAVQQCGNLRIDTHKDNHIMQNLLKKNGFEYCGIVYAKDGSPRLAYQKTIA